MAHAHVNELLAQTELIPQERYDTQRAKDPGMANLNKLHKTEVERILPSAPQLRMSWADYDKFISRDDLCIYDLLSRAAFAGVFDFLLSREHASYILSAAVGMHGSVMVGFFHERGIVRIDLS